MRLHFPLLFTASFAGLASGLLFADPPATLLGAKLADTAAEPSEGATAAPEPDEVSGSAEPVARQAEVRVHDRGPGGAHERPRNCQR